MTVRIKRVYDEPAADDGFRVLVDRLWPRGLARERAAIDEWLRDVAPSTELRKWFDHDPAKRAEFANRYRAELSSNPAMETLRGYVAAHDTVTLLHPVRDESLSHAVVLGDKLR